MNKEQMNMPNEKDKNEVDHSRRDFLKKTAGYAGAAATIGVSDLYAGEKKKVNETEMQKMNIEDIRDKFDDTLRDLVILINESQIDGDMQKLIIELRNDIGDYLDDNTLDSDALSEFGNNLNRKKIAQEKKELYKEVRIINDIMKDIEAVLIGIAPLGLHKGDDRKGLSDKLKDSVNELQDVSLAQ